MAGKKPACCAATLPAGDGGAEHRCSRPPGHEGLHEERGRISQSGRNRGALFAAWEA